MSDEFENFLMNQKLAKPSNSLDDRILDLLDPAPKKMKSFPWQKVLTYSAAAGLFLAIGVSELLKQYASDTNSAPVKSVDKTNSSAVNDVIRVNTTESKGDFATGEIFEVEDGKFVKPVIRRVLIKKSWFDEDQQLRIESEEPHHELFYVPVAAD
jgi:hypothetical protein